MRLAKPKAQRPDDADDIAGGWIQTFTGRKFFPLDASPRQVYIEDIAHALALVNRYGGHTREPYSVAQHSVYVSLHCDPVDALWGLLHDASEAYIGDVVRPIKRLAAFDAYRDVETDLMACVCERFGLPYIEPESVKRADLLLLTTESRDLRSPLVSGWRFSEANGYPALAERIAPWIWQEAERRFLARYLELAGAAAEKGGGA
jgi:5'-deoxynucleotidase YfbR-like HD superfamily hydrolase